MAGNRLGNRARVIYEGEEAGKVYILQIDASFVIAGAGTGAAAPTVFNPSSPPTGIDYCPSPKRFKPRVVFAQSASGDATKTIVCCSAESDLYATTLPKNVTIDGETFTTTGRRGEKLSF